jgi:MATE family multidrug resistance protein
LFSMVIAVRVGYHLGRGDGAAARRSFWIATGVVFAMLAVIVAVVLPFAWQTVALTTSDQTVVNNAARVLPAALIATLLGREPGGVSSSSLSHTRTHTHTHILRVGPTNLISY